MELLVTTETELDAEMAVLPLPITPHPLTLDAFDDPYRLPGDVCDDACGDAYLSQARTLA